MDADDQYTLFAKRGLLQKKVTKLFGWHFRNFVNPEFHADLLNVLQGWNSWFSQLLQNIEDHVPQQYRAVLDEATFPVYLVLRDVIKEVQYDLNIIRNRNEGRPELPSRITISGEEVEKRNKNLEIDSVIFLQRLPLLYCVMRRPIPTGNAPWEATVPIEDMALLRQMIFRYKREMSTLMAKLAQTLRDELLRRFEVQKIDEFIKIRWKRFTGESEDIRADDSRMKEISRECEGIVMDVMRTNQQWQRLLNQLLQAMTTKDIETDNPMAMGQPLENFSSFLRRFLYLMWTVVGQTGRVMNFNHFLTVLKDLFK